MEKTCVGTLSDKPPLLCSHIHAANAIDQAAKVAREDAWQALELLRAAAGEEAASGSLPGLLGR